MTVQLKPIVKAFLSVLVLVIVWHPVALFGQNLKQEFPRSFVVEVSNPLKQQHTDVMVHLKEEEIEKNASSFSSKAFVVLDGTNEVPSQYNHDDPAKAGIIAVLPQLGAGASKKITIRFKEEGEVERNYPKRTQAELSHKVGGHFEDRKYIGGEFQNVDSLRVPDEHTDHSYYIRYEGPGWESDKVGYRFYLDWRNGVDVFGKTTDDMVLQQVGLDGFDSYHEMQPWGMDILKVGKALGVGSLALFHDGKAIRVDETDSIISRITENGPVYSSITTDYYGWDVAGQKLDIQSILGIHAGSRLTHQQVRVNGTPDNLATGLTKDSSAPLQTSKGSEEQWGYIATYGVQSLNKDNVGLAVLFKPQDLLEISEDEHSHVVKLKPTDGRLEYYFLAAWELEKEGIKNEQQFMEYLNKAAAELAQPLELHFVAK
jgi:hypothetical protein